MKLKISLYMVTFNEEKRLERTLKAVSDLVDEIIASVKNIKDREKIEIIYKIIKSFE